MDKKVVVLIRAGVPYKNTVMYGRQRAREAGAKLVLAGVVPALGPERRAALAAYDLAPFESIGRRFEEETAAYLDRAVQFCLDNGITTETQTVSGGMDTAIRQFGQDTAVKLVVVPTPTKKEHHSEFFDVLESLKHFTQDVIEPKLCCPVVSVVAA
jgi:nucleotide-binding universal stress UspA family protein